MSAYSYARGPLLDERQHYRYSRYEGAPFLDAWRASRDGTLASLPAAAQAPLRPAALPLGACGADALLDALHHAAAAHRLDGDARARLDHLVQRFEVTKRVFGAYDADLRAADRDDFRDLGRYLRLAELLDAAFAATGALPYLSALLKCADILCAYRAELTEEQGARLARVLVREGEHVASCHPARAQRASGEMTLLSDTPAACGVTRLPGVVFLAARTTRSQAYAQAMAREGLVPEQVILYGARSTTAPPVAPPGLDAGLPLADLTEPLEETCRRAGWAVRSLDTQELNDDAVVAAVAAARPRVLVFSSFGGQLAREPLLAAGRQVLHVHAGWLPEERGSTTIYYGMLAERRCAASALLLTPRIDAGPVLARRTFPMPPAALDVDHLYDGAMRAAVLLDVLRGYARSGALPAPVCAPDAPGTTYYVIHPVLKHLALLSR